MNYYLKKNSYILLFSLVGVLLIAFDGVSSPAIFAIVTGIFIWLYQAFIGSVIGKPLKKHKTFQALMLTIFLALLPATLLFFFHKHF